MPNLRYNPEPSRDLGYSSLQIDEEARFHRHHHFSKEEKFAKTAPNGNLRFIVPDIDDEEVRKALPRPLRVDTNTRTVFQDNQYDLPGTVEQHVADPQFRTTAPRQSGHKGMDRMAPTDPRQQHVKPGTKPEVGPGTYNLDPLNDKTCGMAVFEPGDSHHMVNFAKDPTRPSPNFRSPERGQTAAELQEQRACSGIPHYFVGLDYSSWTARGMHMSKQARNIDSERWGKDVRNPRPHPKDMAVTMRDPQVTSHCKSGTTAHYINSPDSPKYRSAFGSALPRLMALPGGLHPDTRLVAKDHETLSPTAVVIGPGAYRTDLARYKSCHAALDTSPAYESLGASSPKSEAPSPTAAHHHHHHHHPWDASSTAHSPTSPRKLHTPGSHTSSRLGAVTLQASPTGASPRQGGGHPWASAPPSPHLSHHPMAGQVHLHTIGALSPGSNRPRSVNSVASWGGAGPFHTLEHQTSCGVGSELFQGQECDPDWFIHQALVLSEYASAEDLCMPGDPISPYITVPPTPCQSATAPSHGVGAEGDEELPAVIDLDQLDRPPEGIPHPQRGTAACNMSPRRAGPFDQLAFLSRSVPHNKIITSRLVAVADLKKARAAVKSTG